MAALDVHLQRLHPRVATGAEGALVELALEVVQRQVALQLGRAAVVLAAQRAEMAPHHPRWVVVGPPAGSRRGHSPRIR